jgi:hypothetical protein
MKTHRSQHTTHAPPIGLLSCEDHLRLLLKYVAVVLCCADVIDRETLVILTQLLQPVVELAARQQGKVWCKQAASVRQYMEE